MTGPLAVTGVAAVVLRPGDDEPDCAEHLRVPKLRKCMGKQDRLAVLAGCRAAAQAGLGEEIRAERTLLAVAVGPIPFEGAEIDALAGHSERDGVFAMDRFAAEALQQVNPLLTFRCLPNMPAFHVSLCLGMRGPAFVTYPGPGQCCQAIERAAQDLADGRVDAALVVAVADQDNRLVRWHHARLRRVGERPDVAAAIVLERPDDAARRGARALAALDGLAIAWSPRDPFGAFAADEHAHACAAPLTALHARLGRPGPLRSAVLGADGLQALLAWSVG